VARPEPRTSSPPSWTTPRRPSAPRSAELDSAILSGQREHLIRPIAHVPGVTAHHASGRLS
jgi:hypothetical protein